jgi:aerobic carbon-monoxide dehydrogenase medium subunit
VIPSTFDYVRAGSAEEALALLVEHGEDAKLLAGGHSLLPMIKLRLAQPTVLIDVAPIESLRYQRIDGDALAIGALSTHAQVAASVLVREQAPLLAHGSSLVGDPQVRHRGTIGGSTVHADAKADVPLALLASGATLVILGPHGRREVPVDDFFLGFYETAVGPQDMLLEIRLPLRAGQGWGYEKFVRRANDWAIVGVATVGGRVALASMGDRPLRAAATESALADGASIEAAAALADQETEPVEDIHAGPAYRRHLARVLTGRALSRASSVPA